MSQTQTKPKPPFAPERRGTCGLPGCERRDRIHFVIVGGKPVWVCVRCAKRIGDDIEFAGLSAALARR